MPISDRAPAALLAALLPAALLVAALLPAAASAQQPEWTGRLRCDEMQGIAQALNTPVTLRVDNGMVRYMRDVRDARTGGVAGFAETGSGTLGPNGELTLTGSAITAHSRYTATYSGRIGANGRGTLTGAQDWEFRSSGARHRPCTMSITAR